MVKLVLDEFRKLKRTWILPTLPAVFLLAPVLGVLTVRSNALNDDRILFDLATIFTQVQLDNSILVAPLALGSLAIFVLQREYQEATLGPLLTVPIRRSDLLTAKVILVGLVGLLGALFSAVMTLPLAWLAGAPSLDAHQVFQGSARLVVGELLTLPCVLLQLLAVVLFRNYLTAMTFAFVTIVFGMVAISLSDVASLIPWLSPTLLSVDTKAIEMLGLTPADVSQSALTFTVFSVAVTSLLYVLFKKRAEA